MINIKTLITTLSLSFVCLFSKNLAQDWKQIIPGKWDRRTLIYAQGFKGISPLESTCEDVKRVLKVKKCMFPFSIYYLKDYTVSMYYTKEKPTGDDKLCFNVPAGRVASITVSYNQPFPIKDFEYELKYAEGPFGDIDTVAYENSEKGVSVFVHNGLITNAVFGPTPEQFRKFSYDCKAKNVNFE